ncbi:MAG TPA: hypothetical protein VMG41_06480 [Gemmatimonadales bacterium]|nr:hypothetical protein [Gemmatimonadales bacterium]
MCRRSGALLGTLAALMAAGPLAGLVPQGAPADSTLHRLARRADSLEREWIQARVLVDLSDSLGRAAARAATDTFRAGSLVVIANHSPLPLAGATRQAWSVLDSLYGDRAMALSGRPIVLHIADSNEAVKNLDPVLGLGVPWDADSLFLVRFLLAYVPVDQPDLAFQEWLGGRLGPSLNPGSDLEATYLDLVTTPFQVDRSCYRGGLAACRIALGLEDSASAVETYMTERERRDVASRVVVPGTTEEGTSPGFRACIAGVDSACIAIIHATPPRALPRPLGSVARGVLVRLALAQGGRGAYDRLLSGSGGPVGQLSAASEIPLDSLLAQWRRRVLSARPTPVTLPHYGVLLGVGWILVLGLCASRSSRWRVN